MRPSHNDSAYYNLAVNSNPFLSNTFVYTFECFINHRQDILMLYNTVIKTLLSLYNYALLNILLHCYMLK